MSIGLLQLSLYIPSADSLKSKRNIIQSMIKRLKNRFNVAVAEIGAQDLHQKCELGIVSINSSPQELQRTLDYVVTYVKGNPESEIIHMEMELL